MSIGKVCRYWYVSGSESDQYRYRLSITKYPVLYRTCTVGVPAGVVLEDHALVRHHHHAVRHGRGAGQALQPRVRRLSGGPRVLGQHRPTCMGNRELSLKYISREGGGSPPPSGRVADPAPDPANQNFENRIRILLALTRINSNIKNFFTSNIFLLIFE